MQEQQQNSSTSTTALVVGAIVVFVLGSLLWYVLTNDNKPKEQSKPVAPQTQTKVESLPKTEPEAIVEPTPEPVSTAELKPEQPLQNELDQQPTIEQAPAIEQSLPELDQSDALVQKKLSELTWRKELLKLVVSKDMIRRFVVFTDNFARGIIAYRHSPLVKPSSRFTAIDTHKLDEKRQEIWQWDVNSSRRFALYVDLIRSFNADELIAWYQELKPLIDKAYGELGYPDDDFTDTLQQAITRVLDMDIPKGDIEIIRPSVMFKYKDPQLEARPAADKLLLRIGKENLLVIKSVLLEMSEKLSRIDE